MSTQTEPSDHLRRTLETSADATERRPAGGTIVLSLIAGAVAALVLVLGVFAGGTEATITGALLLGFGFGWALIATLTLRRTRQPQRWAVVPAVTVGTTGAAR
jgi:formate/nitrite transporter FocA (FNT family)